jgi:hypothetical protein
MNLFLYKKGKHYQSKKLDILAHFPPFFQIEDSTCTLINLTTINDWFALKFQQTLSVVSTISRMRFQIIQGNLAPPSKVYPAWIHAA